MQRFDAIFEIFGRAVFEDVEAEWRSASEFWGYDLENL